MFQFVFVNPKLRWENKSKPHSQGIYKYIYTWQVMLCTKEWNNNPRLISLDGKNVHHNSHNLERNKKNHFKINDFSNKDMHKEWKKFMESFETFAIQLH